MNDTAPTPLVSSPEGVLAVLCMVTAFWFFVARRTGWKIFDYVIPLIWIYATPFVLNNVGVIPSSSPVYSVLSQYVLPAMLCLLLLSIDVGAAVRVMGKGVLVMLLGTVGIVLGAPVGYFAVKRWLEPDAWTGFGALAGSWIGGTGNMAAMSEALATPPEQFGLAVLADNVVYLVWLPILLGSKVFAERFNKWARVPEDRLAKMEAAAALEEKNETPATMVDYLQLAFLAAATTAVAAWLASILPEIAVDFPSPDTVIVSASTWKVLLITTIGIGLSLTPARRLPGSHELAMGMVYVFVAGMGARASLSGLDQALPFIAGAFIWIFVHGAFCLLGAWLFRVDVHSTAIASAANVGAAASAPVVAAAHRESLVPASILMALLGYALGNYMAFLAAQLCRLVGAL